MNFPGESPEYRSARDLLLAKEIELRNLTEEVAAARRNLPPGGEIPEDYVFDGLGANAAPAKIKLSELFAEGLDSLVIYNFMFPRHPTDDRPGPDQGLLAQIPLEQGPCPSCVALLDQLDGAAKHLAPQLTFVVVAKTPLDRLLAFGKDRGWRHLRLLSSATNTFKRDYQAEDADGSQMPMLTVFSRKEGKIRHFWSSELLYAPVEPGQDPRHTGTIEPLWNMFDFTAEGRPANWNEQLHYDCCH
jgi:predicted dithiol-disulfide oxidoreductase (DUF899 family)